MRYRGEQLSHTGAGMAARFDGPARAAICAAHLVEALAASGIAVRAGLHTGEVELDGTRVGGLAVHHRARVMGVAGAGEVRVSGPVRDLVAGSGIESAPRGERHLKGVPGRR